MTRDISEEEALLHAAVLIDEFAMEMVNGYVRRGVNWQAALVYDQAEEMVKERLRRYGLAGIAPPEETP